MFNNKTTSLTQHTKNYEFLKKFEKLSVYSFLVLLNKSASNILRVTLLVIFLLSQHLNFSKHKKNFEIKKNQPYHLLISFFRSISNYIVDCIVMQILHNFSCSKFVLVFNTLTYLI